MPLAESELEPLLRLALVEGVGPHRLSMLLERFGDPERAIAASPAQLRSLPRIGAELARRIRAAGRPVARADARAALSSLRRLGAVALTRDDPAYPEAFRTLREPPFLLFAAGALAAMESPAVAVVGTRSPSAYGRSAAESLSHDLALAGFTIVSGLARGIDSAAHRGALEAGGMTIGILGHGIEQVYPPENGALFTAVRRNGLLLTEFPPGETPRSGNFPRRNRLITALSEGVIVVEMAQKSGAQHTVNFAIEQGKEVMAVPGPILSQRSEGTNQLIKDGARLVTSARDVVEELWGVGRGVRIEPGVSAGDGEVGPALPSDLTPAQAEILQHLATGTLHVDEVASASCRPVSEVLRILLELEFRGLITALPGKRFRRA